MDAARRKIIHQAMVRLSDGDRASLEVLIDELWPVVLAFAERGVSPAADAEDVAQEAFFKICTRIIDFDRERDGLSWAFGIASYEIMTHRRRFQRRREIFHEAAVLAQRDESASQEDTLLAKEIADAFEQAVGSLTAEDRVSLGLQGGLPADVAEATLRKRKQRAVDRLRGIWRNIYGEP